VVAIVTVWLRTRTTTPQVEGVVQLTHDGEPKPVPGAIASDGSRLYFKERRSGVLGISQVSVAGGETALLSSSLTSPEVLEVAPDLSTLLVTSGAEEDTFAAMLPLPVGQMRKLLKADAAAFFPDGRRIVYMEGINIYTAQSDGSNVQKISELQGSLFWPAVARDGQRIRFTLLNDDGLSLWEVQTNGKGLRPLLPHWKEPHFEFGGKWTPDGNYFIFQREEAGRWDLWAIPEKHGILSTSVGEPVRITNGPLSYGAPLPSRDGKQIFAIGSQTRGELIRYDSATKRFLPTFGGMSVTDVMYSQDGKWLVYLSYPDHTLWRSRAVGTERMQLTYAPLEVFYPHISPDGKQVVFSAWLPGRQFEVFIVSMSGGEPRHVADGIPAAWSPDGKSLVFGQEIPGKQAGEPGFRELAILDLESGRISRIPDSRSKGGAFWPAQQLLVAGGEQGRLYSFDVATQTWSKLAEGPVSDWMISPNSQYLYYIKETPGNPEAMRVRVADRKIEVVASLQGVQRTSDQAIWGESWVGVAPDGSLLLSRDVGTQEIYAIRLRWP
jgi:Tol biopolymer transport system component